MTSNAGIVLVVGGILLGLVGGVWWISSQASHNDCQNDWVRTLNREACREADTEYSMGIAGLIIAGILTFIGIVLLAGGKPKPQYSQFTCSRCQWEISYYNSPQNCANCGLPIDWSKGQMPRK